MERTLFRHWRGLFRTRILSSSKIGRFIKKGRIIKSKTIIMQFQNIQNLTLNRTKSRLEEEL